MEYQIIKRKRVFDRFIKVDEVTLKREKFRATGPETVKRYHIVRPNAVGVLLENISRQKIILVEQFRYASLSKPSGNGWTLEIVAGLIDKDETPLVAAKRETLEETGYQVEQLIPIATYFTSIGISDEQIHLFYGQVTDSEHVGSGGGVEQEGEDLQIRELDYSALMDRIRNLEIYDGKTIIAAQWLSLRRLSETANQHKPPETGF